MLKRIQDFFKSISHMLSLASQKQTYTPAFRLIEIQKNESDEYIVMVQVINKNLTFHSKPEEILAKDDLVDQFSPRDIRTLTYLGYLEINSPKYTILAKRLS